MPKYVDGAGLQRFWDNIQGQIGNASQEQVDAWLDEHPEATTTVQDGAITTAKLADGAVTNDKLAQTGGVLTDVANLDVKVNMAESYVEYWGVGGSQSATANLPGVHADGDVLELDGALNNSFNVRLSTSFAVTTSAATRRGWTKSLALTEGHLYRLTSSLLDGSVSVSSDDVFKLVCLYDEENVRIAGVPVDGGSTEFAWHGGNAMLCFVGSSGAVFSSLQSLVTLQDVTESMRDVDEWLTAYKGSAIDVFPGDTDLGMGYSGTTSTIVSASSYNITDYIPCDPTEPFTALSYPPSNYNDGKAQPTFVYLNSDVEYAKIAYYDSEKNWIKTVDTTTTETPATIYPEMEGFIRIQHRVRNIVRVFKDGVDYIDATKVRHPENVIDLFIFMGQSNMGGRGETSVTWPQTAPNVIPGAGWEFKAVSDPTGLYMLREPFGYAENVSGAIDDGTRKTGGCVVSFANEYYTHSGVPIVGVSASEGGTTISGWQPSGSNLTDAINRLTTAVTWLESNGYTIRHKFMCWCQGESDGDSGTTKANYITGFNAMFSAMKSAGIEKCFLFRIGEYNGTSSTDYSTIIEAQTEICQTDADVVLVTANQASYKARGLMKDSFHYYQAAYNEMGEYAGVNAALYVETGKEPTMYDTKSGELYYSHVN